MRRVIAGISLLVASCGPRPSPLPAVPFRPTAIVIHSTSGLDRDAAIAAMKRIGAGVHVLIDANGSVHRLLPNDRMGHAARGMDDVALHVSVVGGLGAELLANPRILEAAANVVGGFADRLAIPKSNADVISRRGIFSHQQAKYRFGGLKRGEERDRMEPGEDFMKALLGRIGGEFREEKDWVGRGAERWVCV